MNRFDDPWQRRDDAGLHRDAEPADREESLTPIAAAHDPHQVVHALVHVLPREEIRAVGGQLGEEARHRELNHGLLMVFEPHDRIAHFVEPRQHEVARVDEQLAHGQEPAVDLLAHPVLQAVQGLGIDAAVQAHIHRLMALGEDLQAGAKGFRGGLPHPLARITQDRENALEERPDAQREEDVRIVAERPQHEAGSEAARRLLALQPLESAIHFELDEVLVRGHVRARKMSQDLSRSFQELGIPAATEAVAHIVRELDDLELRLG
mmetsp:Transcript_8501/g.32024  ORF Transcript_8501/g.32024 Transcript_8501/m.32024 type:complete len:265 (+) Transcript_8501:200-994(+)